MEINTSADPSLEGVSEHRRDTASIHSHDAETHARFYLAMLLLHCPGAQLWNSKIIRFSGLDDPVPDSSTFWLSVLCYTILTTLTHMLTIWDLVDAYHTYHTYLPYGIHCLMLPLVLPSPPWCSLLLPGAPGCFLGLPSKCSLPLTILTYLLTM